MSRNTNAALSISQGGTGKPDPTSAGSIRFDSGHRPVMKCPGRRAGEVERPHQDDCRAAGLEGPSHVVERTAPSDIAAVTQFSGQQM